MPKKQPLDKLRDSAVQVRIGTADDQSRVSEFITVGKDHLVVKEKGVYEVKLADQIDPERTNASTSNTSQKILGYGSESEWFGRTLLTANKLLNKHFLPDGIDVERALILAFDAVKTLAAMQDIAAKFANEEAAITLQEMEGESRSLSLPDKIDVETVCYSFIQQTDRAIQKLFGVVKVFYGEAAGKQWFESFTAHIQEKHGPNDLFSQFMNDALLFLQFVRNNRNCVEHPVEGKQQAIITDFKITADSKIYPPTIEVLHPKSQQQPISVSKFMLEVNEHCVGIFELLFAFMCGKHAQQFSVFDTYVTGWAPDQRREQNV